MLESNTYAFKDQALFSHKGIFHIIHLLNDMNMCIIRIVYIAEYGYAKENYRHVNFIIIFEIVYKRKAFY